MAKYIDADCLKAKIDRIEEEARKVRVSGTDKEAIGADGKVKLCLKLKSIIDSLQQEQMKETYCPRSEKWREVEETARHEYENGWKDCMDQMMEKAVEGEVRRDGTIGYFEFSNEQQFHSLLEQFQDCDKVHIIVCKKED